MEKRSGQNIKASELKYKVVYTDNYSVRNMNNLINETLPKKVSKRRKDFPTKPFEPWGRFTQQTPYGTVFSNYRTHDIPKKK